MCVSVLGSWLTRGAARLGWDLADDECSRRYKRTKLGSANRLRRDLVDWRAQLGLHRCYVQYSNWRSRRYDLIFLFAFVHASPNWKRPPDRRTDVSCVVYLRRAARSSYYKKGGSTNGLIYTNSSFSSYRHSIGGGTFGALGGTKFAGNFCGTFLLTLTFAL